MNWKAYGRKWLRANSEFYPNICLEGVRKTSVRIVFVPSKIWTRSLLNMSQNYYHLCCATAYIWLLLIGVFEYDSLILYGLWYRLLYVGMLMTVKCNLFFLYILQLEDGEWREMLTVCRTINSNCNLYVICVRFMDLERRNTFNSNILFYRCVIYMHDVIF